MKAHHAPQVDRADDIDVVQDKGLFVTPAGRKEMRGILQAAAGVQQLLLARDFNPHAEVIVGPQVIGDHPGVVVRVDDHLAHAKRTQAAEGNLQQSAAGNGDQRLGAVVGEWPQARAQTGGQNHRLH